MVLIGLLIVAVVSLVLGLALTSTVWLIVSLVASVLAAAALLVLVRAQRRSAAPETSDQPSQADSKATAENGAQDKEPARVPVAVGAGAAQSEAAGTNAVASSGGAAGGGEQKKGRFSMSKRNKTEDAVADDATSEAADADLPGAAAAAADAASGHGDSDVTAFDEHAEAMVIDGKPDYHRANCAELASARGEKVPLAQAIEDGFSPCATCKPETSAGGATDDRPAAAVSTHANAGAAVPTGAQASQTGDVWVVDGQPDYHRERCERVPAGASEKIPHDQAVEDGFATCTACRPDDAQSTDEHEPTKQDGEAEKQPALVTAGSGHDQAAGGGARDFSSALVWVADGYPEYHVHDCGELQGLTSESVAYDQAVEDGFQPCVVCDPDSAIAGRRPSGVQPDTDDAENVGTAFAAGGDTSRPGVSAASSVVWVVDGQADYHRQSCERVHGQDAEQIPRKQAVEDGFTPCEACTPADAEAADAGGTPDTSSTAAAPVADEAGDEAQVDAWVVDGFPDFHRPECPKIIGLDSQPIPYDQATEDGFTPCSVCRPDADEAPDMTPAPVLAENAATSQADPGDAAAGGDAPTRASGDPVWVVDGFPDFHRRECTVTQGLDAEQIPGDQAVEDGFTPCAVCNPLGDAPTEAPAASSGADDHHDAASPESAQVRVADGFPEYHREGCRTLSGLDDEPIPHDQAVEDGFSACEVCRPEDEQAPDGSLGDESAGDTDADSSADDAEAATAAAAAEAASKAKAEADEKANAEADAKAKAEAEADEKAKADADAKAKAEAEAAEKAKADADAKAKAEADEKAKAEADAKAKAEADEKAKAEADANAKAEVDEKAKADADAKAKAEADEQAAASADPVDATGPASGSARRVWVLDGRPRYHAQDCLIIKGQPAQAVGLDDAVEQGFAPCSLCSRD